MQLPQQDLPQLRNGGSRQQVPYQNKTTVASMEYVFLQFMESVEGEE